MKKAQAKKIAIEMKNKGFKVPDICDAIGKSVSTVYLYLREDYHEKRLPALKQEIKHALLCGDFREYIKSLPYKDLCLIRNEFTHAGYNKLSTIMGIWDYFKDYSLLGLYPENISREEIKRAFKRQAKKVHPDLNPQLSKSGTEFIKLQKSYHHLMACSF